jgi:hypothetical protein
MGFEETSMKVFIPETSADGVPVAEICRQAG